MVSYKTIKLSENLTFYDSCLYKISIYTTLDKIVYVEVVIKLVYPCDMFVKLIFKDVIEYYFSWNKDYIFFIIESYKLLRSENGLYYCSFDPADDNISISKDDGDVIISNSIEGYYSNDMDFTNFKIIQFME